MDSTEQKQSNLSLLRERLGAGRMRAASRLVGNLHPAELARLLESLPLREPAA